MSAPFNNACSKVQTLAAVSRSKILTVLDPHSRILHAMLPHHAALISNMHVAGQSHS